MDKTIESDLDSLRHFLNNHASERTWELIEALERIAYETKTYQSGN
jgi:hypothetical protein